VFAAAASSTFVVDIEGNVTDVQASASLARRWWLGRPAPGAVVPALEFRFGAGLSRSADQDRFRSARGIYPTLEAAMLLSIAYDNWAVTLGPIVTRYDREHAVVGSWDLMEVRDEVRVVVLGGLRRRL
jgi:hypothetical protein